MIQSLQDTNQNLSRLILQRIIPVIAIAFAGYVVIIGIATYNSIESNLSSDHKQSNAILQAQLITELNFLLSENQEVANTGQLRSQASQLLRSGIPASNVVNNLFSDIIRFNPSEYLAVQYITSNGVIFNEVVNERGIPRVSGASRIPRSEPAVVQSTAFQNALQAINPDDYYLSNFTLVLDERGEPVTPLQTTFSVYVPIFDLVNPRAPLGTVRFIISAETMLDIFNNPLLNESNTSEQSAFLFDNRGNMIANSYATSQDYLYHLIDRELEDEHVDEYENFHNAVASVVRETDAKEITLQAENGDLYTIRDFKTGDNHNTVWHIVVTESQSALFTSFMTTMIFIIGATLAVVVTLLYFIHQRMRPVLEPFMDVSRQAQQIASGHPTTGDNVAVSPIANIGVLPISAALSTLSERIQNLTGELSDQETRHNRDMQIITNIGRETATLYDIDSLMQRAIELICNELGFYHAQIFLVDDAQVNAVLVQSRGEAGQQLLAQGHQLAIGSDSIIGAVTSKGIPVIVNDTTARATTHGFNPFLPDTRAEMALPLAIGSEIIGAIDVQSTEPHVFHDEDLPTFQLIADQL